MLLENIVEEVGRLLGPPTFHLPPRWGQYDWRFHYKLPTQGQGIIFFTADTSKNLQIALSPDSGSVFPMYEIVIDWQQTWDRTHPRSEIRWQTPKRTLCTYTSLDLTKPLGEELYHFWFFLDAKTQLIYVGRGEHPCEEDAFIIFKDPSFLSNVQYFTFTSNYLAITYTGIKVEPTTPTILGSHGQDSSSHLWSSINTTQVPPQSLKVTFSKSSESYGDYNWPMAYKFPTGGRGVVCFTANAIRTDIHLAISPKPQTMDPMYEIVIGGCGNTECAIRRKAQGENMCLVRTIGVLKLGKPTQFWVSLNVDTQLIHVGSGNQPNLESIICIYKDPNFISGARYVSFFSWETTTFYSNIYVASPSVSRLLGSEEPLEVGSCWGKYNWESNYKLLSEGQGILYFVAKASTDVYVAISSKEETMEPMYEVVIGGWGNTKSGIRRCSQGELVCCVNEGLHNAHNEENVSHQFWVSLDKDTQLIHVGRGRQANLESVVCMYKDPNFLCEAMYVAFSSWDTPITYSSITVSFHSTTIMTPIEASAIQTSLEMAVGADTVQDRPVPSVDFIPETFKSANNILLDNPDLEVGVMQTCWGQYEWRQYFELPCMGRGVVYFAAETITDVHIAISSQPKTMDPMYEIVIGGWNNSMSVVRRKSQGHNLCCAVAGIDDLPIEPGVNHYWVSIDASTKFIKFGFGRQAEVESSMICIYKDAYFISDARYFTFTNWSAPVVYSNISVGTISSPLNPASPSFENLHINESIESRTIR